MVIITLPAYNEETTLPRLLVAIREAMEESQIAYRVIVVNDGSTDATAKVSRDLAARGVPLTLVDHERNRGLGESIRTGLMHALVDAADKDIIVTMDSDNTHGPGLIVHMVRNIREGNDVVIASRYRSGARIKGVPGYRRLLSRVGRLRSAWSSRRPTCATSRRAIAPTRPASCARPSKPTVRSSWRRAASRAWSTSCSSCGGFDAIMSEVPLVLRYDLKEGVSKMLVVRTIFETLALMLRRRFSG